MGPNEKAVEMARYMLTLHGRPFSESDVISLAYELIAAADMWILHGKRDAEVVT